MARRFGRSAANAEPKQPLKVLRADGARIDLTRRDTGPMLAATRQDWQKLAFAYRDLIGELRFAHRLLGHGVAGVRFYVAEQRPHPDDPIALDDEQPDTTLDPQLVADAILNFNRIPFDTNPDGFTARLVENFSAPGEAWVHIDEKDRFWVRSISEVTTSGDGRVALNALPTAATGTMRYLDPEAEDLLRLWVPHPEWAALADSPMRSSLDVCEDVVLAGREQRAAARSRVAANGFLLVPDTLSLVRSRDEDDEDGDGLETDTFMQDLTEAMLAPIRDDGDAQAVVPIVIRGSSEDLKEMRHLTVQREESEQLIMRQSTALLRLLKGLDIQPEQVEGVAGMNHWGAWIIDARSIRDQIVPMAETVASSMVQAFLRPALLSLGHPEPAVDKVTIAVDPSPLAENPNRGQDARDAHAAMVISDATMRTALGFDDSDAPDDEEKLRRLAASGNLPVGVTAALFGLSAQDVAKAAVVEGTIAEAQGDEDANPAAGVGAPGAAPKPLPSASPGQTVPSSPVPAEPRGPITAAADPLDGWMVDVDLARQLADIDAALADRIATAADAALARVIEKAGARVRSAAQRDKQTFAALSGVEVHRIPARLGRNRVESFIPVADLIADGYTRLRGQVLGWLGDAAAQVADVLVRMLRLEPGSREAEQVRARVEQRLGSGADKAWSQLAASLDEAAERVLFEPDPFTPATEERGEVSDTIIRPREVVDVLTVAGGGTPTAELPGPVGEPGGFATGPTVLQLAEDEGGVVLGWEWRYHPERLRRRPFLPHQRLDGVRFSTFTDPKLDTDTQTAWLGAYFRPQDHDGCLCGTTPVLAFPELDDDTGGDIVERRLREARESERGRAEAQVAADDTAAGRVGTTIQNEVEVRDRVYDQVKKLRERHIEGASA